VERIYSPTTAGGGRSHQNGFEKNTRYHQFDAPVVVSNADALHTYRDLLKDESLQRLDAGHLESLRPTFACFLTHIGLRGMDPKALAGRGGVLLVRTRHLRHHA